jgi:hypothetical protein
MKFYKLRDMTNGKYSMGGNYPKWNDKGKIWLNIGSLKSHLTTYSKTTKQPISPFWEVIEMEVTEALAYPAVALAKKPEAK